MTEDLDMFWNYCVFLHFGGPDSEYFPIPIVVNPASDTPSLGEMYLRCDKGNPGDVFKSIEVIAFKVAFNVLNKPNITIDNICMKYYCFGVTACDVKGLHVTNCEIG